ncbi:MAG: hypothetical protein DRQ40_05550 [Gammaproteobacteria bacterium]|nr:MAG: hypothetical protein DRQ40_05550 [Gammaproteobacteria bacterium]RLA00892.1 MAG: hypothetical protein DRQ42_04485 [Gammaproteobacteria bacterium]
MKKFIGFLGLLLILASGPIIAGETTDLETALQKKKLLVLDGMKLSDETEVEFLPVYNAYQKDLIKSARTMSAIIVDFSKNYNALTNVKAQELLAKWLDEQQSKLNLKKEYVAKFEKVMSKKELMRYYQIENKLESIVDNELRKAIPLAK